MTLSLSLAGVIAWALQSYRSVDVATSLSFFGSDGWCEPETQGFGVHCWGDWAAIRFNDLSQVPSTAEAVYPLSSRLVRLPFELVASVAGDRIALLVFLSVSAVCLLAPWLEATRELPWQERLLSMGVGCVLTAPFAVALDRGNLIALVVPLLALWLSGLASGHFGRVSVAIVLTAAIKPQFALLAVALLALREYRWLLRTVLAVVGVWLLPLLLHAGGPVAGLRTWTLALASFAQSQPLGQDFPLNVSLARALDVLFSPLPWIAADVAGVVAMILSLSLLAILAALGGRLPVRALAVVVLALVSLLSPLTYSYYYVFVIPVAAMAFRVGGLQPHASRGLRQGLHLAAIVFSLTPMLLPLRVLDLGDGITVVTTATPLIATMLWAILAIQVTAEALTTGGQHAVR